MPKKKGFSFVGPVKVKHEKGDQQPWIVDQSGLLIAVVYRHEEAEAVADAINAEIKRVSAT